MSYDPAYYEAHAPRPRPRTSAWPFLLAAFLLVVPLIFLAYWFWPGQRPLNDPTASPREITPRGELGADEQGTVQLFKRVSPSVVHVTSQNTEESTEGTGTGFVWDDQGRIITNYHVIRNADQAVAILPDHSSWRAQLVGASPDNDLAVLYIGAPKSRLHPIEVGTSHDLQVGQNAFAIGNPYGLDQSLTKGIVSATNREITSVTRLPIKNVIQTDAAVNPGNSGGPLLDSDGRLIGVTTAIYSPSGANSGIGFAIPVDTVNRVVPELIRDGKIIRPALGVVPADDQLAQRYGVQDGALIYKVAADSPASRAGLRATGVTRDGNVQVGDVILAIDGEPIHSGRDVYSAFALRKVGDTVTLTILRDNQRMEVKATLAGVG
jgi:S1-C subfamily serine protease